jgi:hypothetical protein
MTRTSLPRGQVILELHLQDALRVSNAICTRFPALANLSESGGLAYCLAKLKKTKEKSEAWTRWIASLPSKGVLNYPFYSPDDLEGLRFPQAQSFLLEQIHEFQKDAEKLRGTDVSFKDFRWAVSMVKSRSFVDTTALNRPGTARIFLMPFDFFNCDSSPNIRYSITQDQRLVMETKVDIEAGTELFIGYGPYDNLVYLSHYGFMLEPNPHDVLEFYVRIPDSDPNKQLKIEILKRIWSETSLRIRIALSGQDRSQDDVRIARFAMLEPKDLSAFSIGEILQYRSVSVDNEKNAARAVTQACSMFLEQEKPRGKQRRTRVALKLVERERKLIQSLVSCFRVYSRKMRPELEERDRILSAFRKKERNG